MTSTTATPSGASPSRRRHKSVTIAALGVGVLLLGACRPDGAAFDGVAASRVATPATTAAPATTTSTTTSTTTTTTPVETTTTTTEPAPEPPPSTAAPRRATRTQAAGAPALQLDEAAPEEAPPGPPPAPEAPPAPGPTTASYPWHRGITSTVFWAGEAPSGANGGISNVPSAWDSNWTTHFGGYDDPDSRNGWFPAGFTPKENPFYIALPYNDIGKKDAASIVPWAGSRDWGNNQSMLKNQWVEIRVGGTSVYAQWEDVGPFNENDSAYVFGSAKPASRTNNNAGIDVSPAVRDFLGLGDIASVDWRFVDAGAVPSGPWKQIVTTSGTSWR